MSKTHYLFVTIGAAGLILAGCSSRATDEGHAGAGPIARPSQKVEAFRLIIEEIQKLPPSDEYYRDKPASVQEVLARTTGRQVATIDGMVAIFRIIHFDPSANRDETHEIYKLYQSICGDKYREPYARLLMSIEEAIRPIIEAVEQGSER